MAVSRYKLVTFVPPEHVDRVAEAIFAAGGGRIGSYTRCSFRVEGTGTFLGGDGSSPAIGQPGKFETVREVRLEIEVPADLTLFAVNALNKAHPYEMPAYDLYPLTDLLDIVTNPRPVGD